MSGSTENFLTVRVPWVLGKDGRWIENACVVWDLSQGVVVDVNRGKSSFCKGNVLDFDGRAIIPGLVNAHTHLELSALSGLYRNIPSGDYITWVRELTLRRSALSWEEIKKAFVDAAVACVGSGTTIVGDVSNVPLVKISRNIDSRTLPWRYLFWEWIGFTVSLIKQVFGTMRRPIFGYEGNSWVGQFSIVSHAVYSTSAYLIKKTKDWCRRRGRVFSIHVGENEGERRLIEKGQGPWKEFLEELGKWDDEWQPLGVSPIRYLDNLRILDEQTLLVHCVHLSEDEWDIISKRRCMVCLCPRSNHELGVGNISPVEILKRRIPFLLGTDSLASSPSLNVFEEAVFLLEHFSIFDPHLVLKAMTGEGHRFFMKSKAPFVEVGFKGRVLAVNISPGIPAGELSEEVIYNGLKGAFSWIPAQ
ncbi:MAG: amidohydrolase family protein [Thermodesulforhabdaceae bacterium]